MAAIFRRSNDSGVFAEQGEQSAHDETLFGDILAVRSTRAG
jgi:hypothetical protein